MPLCMPQLYSEMCSHNTEVTSGPPVWSYTDNIDVHYQHVSLVGLYVVGAGTYSLPCTCHNIATGLASAYVHESFL